MGRYTDLSDVTVAIKTFYRTDKLERALKSLVGLNVAKVIVTDDGKITQEKRSLYERFRKFLPLEVVELPYDSGIGKCRNVALEMTETPYFAIMDDDMEATPSFVNLKTILEQDDTLGGVAGCWLEYGKFKCVVSNLAEEGGYLIRYDPREINARFAGNIPYLIFDFIPNSALFRVGALKDYHWDNNYVIGYEHLDFYWGHKKLGRWKFAVTPSTIFFHNPGGSRGYLKNRFSRKKINHSREYFLKKWGLKGVIVRSYGLGDPSLKRILMLKLRQKLPLYLANFIRW